MKAKELIEELEARAEARLKQVNKSIGRLKGVEAHLLWPMYIGDWGRKGGSYGQPYISIRPKSMASKMKTPQPKKADAEARAAWDKSHAWHQGQLMQKVRARLSQAGVIVYAHRNRPSSQSVIVKIK